MKLRHVKLAEGNITANRMLSIERLIPKFVNNMAGMDFKLELNDTAGMDFQHELKSNAVSLYGYAALIRHSLCWEGRPVKENTVPETDTEVFRIFFRVERKHGLPFT